MKDTLEGQRFGRLVVLSYAGKKGKGQARHWLCRCDCGNEKILAGGNLKGGYVKSCGCLRRENGRKQGQAHLNDLTGQRFHRLTVVKFSRTHKGNAYWECDCDCGEKSVTAARYLLDGNTRSCGCLRKELGHEAQLKHEHAINGKPSRTYNSWRAMKKRCLDPNHNSFSTYGGVGITVCDRWLSSFQAFLEDMGERPENTTLHRKDGTKGYSKKNCEWATLPTQNLYRKNVYQIEYEGKLYSLSGLARRFALSPTSLQKWFVVNGLPIEDAIRVATYWKMKRNRGRF